MTCKSRQFSDRWRSVRISLCISTFPLVAGCSQLINPFNDDLPETGSITTASSSRVLDANLPGEEPRQRGWEPLEVQMQNPCVTHWPLWFSDSFEDRGSDDGKFSWTWEDYVGIAHGPGRLALNFVACPASMLVDCPCSVHCSDGVVSPQTFGFSNHDASPAAGCP